MKDAASTRRALRWVGIACFLAPVVVLLAAPHSSAAEKSAYTVGDRLSQKSAKADGYKEISWEELVPADWNPARELQGLDFNILSDADPRAMRALEQLRAELNKAPAVPQLDGARVRIAGFLVPLESRHRQVFEFLLVPYFGACIHTPPPPANQIIHVIPRKPLPAQDSVDAVWINGTLNVARSETGLGSAGYMMRADMVEPYRRR